MSCKRVVSGVVLVGRNVCVWIVCAVLIVLTAGVRGVNCILQLLQRKQDIQKGDDSRYIERPVYRHSSGMGSVIEFNDGRLHKVLVLDSAYRELRVWGACNVVMPRLTKYWRSNTRDDWYLKRYDGVGMSDANINDLWKDSIDENTARQNCDAWILNQGHRDESARLGVPAVEYARSILVNGVGCDIPNIQTLMRVYLEADRIDALDPTVKDNPTKALGSMNPNGYWDCMKSNHAWTSTERNSYSVRSVSANSDCSSGNKNYEAFVIPIQEL